MTDDELNEAYQAISFGNAIPELMMIALPDIGAVTLTKNSITVNDEPATDEQIKAIRAYFKEKP